MKFKNPSILSLLALILLLLGAPGIAATIPSDMKKVAIFIFLADEKGELRREPKTNEPMAIGTGFFMTVKDERVESRFHGYFVTAKHVLTNASGGFFPRVYVRLNKIVGDSEYIPLDLVNRGVNLVLTSPDKTVDIAVVPALPDPKTHELRTVPDKMLTTKETFPQLRLSEGSDMFYPGLFTAHYKERRSNPILRFGRVAMLPEERIKFTTNSKLPSDNAELFLLESHSCGGTSGAPVFIMAGAGLVVGGPDIKLAGVMKGFFNDRSPADFAQAPTAQGLVAFQNNGIAAVTPSYLLHSILFSDTARKLRAGAQR
jgi:hypothetical protein